MPVSFRKTHLKANPISRHTFSGTFCEEYKKPYRVFDSLPNLRHLRSPNYEFFNEQRLESNRCKPPSNRSFCAQIVLTVRNEHSADKLHGWSRVKKSVET